ncbi:MAG: tRNA (cytidine(34)-2'-O)-methyltransferase [Meiothermus sp.]|uniref:tRNA (cytidine(34)-2'-O)-methyltransferase n=1 Tax=Meiothermus sp. TaxID=1955249 RepID=UPI0025D8E0D7|nr:tRNA (cytidine(34)-2'-O)-methyltransferase [Meiothermus sp.]MCS7058113.1 tRNA (cytidine(34)-2'-O)-methyltransferase [Meiothermus sp.]MCS7194364.1 tRNA (cytidine(34)-2'-O)-methyltransferase [Meiothermus sp.]MCX7740274.1 tRNA (cytidine(34)-2'-O)-methyltransferase [Meiothermus sp.]MDW8089845.1 tRNA (cytidine(34)-2'-O)-methyltransferase [Meiothermus sp.]MDW8481728.1 tRNA (cytidine(34)-2'-O)-methyltransferase [Meiothermus sp.]
MVKVVLYQPEIPQNTGNIARTCAVTGAELHLIRPLGFRWGSSRLKRAGLDYWPEVLAVLHDSWEAFLHSLPPDARLWAFSSKAPLPYTAARYRPNDYLLFGPESRGLPQEVLERFPAVSIPMPGRGARSLNLAVAVGVGVYEALRQIYGWEAKGWAGASK